MFWSTTALVELFRGAVRIAILVIDGILGIFGAGPAANTVFAIGPVAEIQHFAAF
jgi:hypothetical protein